MSSKVYVQNRIQVVLKSFFFTILAIPLTVFVTFLTLLLLRGAGGWGLLVAAYGFTFFVPIITVIVFIYFRYTYGIDELRESKHECAFYTAIDFLMLCLILFIAVLLIKPGLSKDLLGFSVTGL
jgi:hypothetical protein